MTQTIKDKIKTKYQSEWNFIRQKFSDEKDFRAEERNLLKKVLLISRLQNVPLNELLP